MRLPPVRAGCIALLALPGLDDPNTDRWLAPVLGCRLAGQHYTLGVVPFAELVRQKLPYASKGTIGHGYVTFRAKTLTSVSLHSGHISSNRDAPPTGFEAVRPNFALYSTTENQDDHQSSTSISPRIAFRPATAISWISGRNRTITPPASTSPETIASFSHGLTPQ